MDPITPKMQMEAALRICNDRGASLPRSEGPMPGKQTRRHLKEVFEKIDAVDTKLPPMEQLCKRLQKADCKISLVKHGMQQRVSYQETLNRALVGRPRLMESYLKNKMFGSYFGWFTGPSHSQLATEICGSYPKIFAILVKSRLDTHIMSFLNARIDDSYLPLRPAPGDGTGDVVLSKSQSHDGERVTINGMDQNDWDTFFIKQVAYLVPFFALAKDGEILHYKFDSWDIIPIVDTAKLPAHDEHSQISNITAIDGGYSFVTKIKLDPMCDGFGDFRFRNNDGWYALKTLKDKSQWGDFVAEVNFWKLWHSREGQELEMSPLLCTWEQRDYYDNIQYCLLFPCASGDLRNLWMQNPSRFTESWLIFQCWRLAKTLSVIHHDKDQKSGGSSDPEELFGRHGDIKPENILWFDKHTGCNKLGTLVLADFGVSKSHRAVTRSQSNNFATRHSLTYRAPEYDLKGNKIGRKADVWALACTWLEFVTWYLKGSSPMGSAFSEARERTDPNEPSVSEDAFFVASKDRKSAEVKEEVITWVDGLYSLSNCTPFCHEFLEYIMSNMLVCQADQRATAGDVASKLKAFLKAYAPDAKKHRH